MDVNRQKFAMNLGLGIMAFHVAFAFILWFVLEFPNDRVAVKEITTPVTVGYAVAVLKYYLDTHGRITSTDVMGIRLAILITGLVVIFCVALIGAPVYYLNEPSITPANLNSFFLFVESAFGALIALIFSYLYGKQEAAAIDAGPVAGPVSRQP